jgi:lipoprotein-anchoring transpeptidase ErfK/SrfK
MVTVAVLLGGTSSPSSHHRVAEHRDPTASRSAGGDELGAPSRAAGGVQIEGLTNNGAGFRAAATPAPVVITLGSDVTSCATNTYRRLLLVSISRQHLWACDGSRQVNSTPVTTGKLVDHDQTPLGSWRVQAEERDRYLVGPGYRDYVHFWVPFNGDFGLHDAPWQTMPFGSKKWRTNGSHGCVHVPAARMAWLYRWAEVGGTVVTVER